MNSHEPELKNSLFHVSSLSLSPILFLEFWFSPLSQNVMLLYRLLKKENI